MSDTRPIISFHVSHPEMAAADIAETLSLAFDTAWTKGEPRITKTGRELSGVAKETYCSLRVPLGSEDVEEELSTLLDGLETKRSALAVLSENGAEFGFYITFNPEGRGQVMSPEVLRRLSDLKIGLSMDWYS